jgi:uncharacterized protein YbaP (TraB family)
MAIEFGTMSNGGIAMKKLANLFLYLFLLTAILGIAAELQHPFLNLPFFSTLEQITWLICLASATLVYLGMGFNRHLPKIILIPLFLWLWWKLIGYWPLENLLGDSFRLYAAGGQLLFGLAILSLNKQLNRKSLFLVRSQFSGPPFSGSNLLRFCLISLPVVPITLLLISYSFVGQLIDVNTGGFVQLKPNGLYLTERIYRQGEKHIRLTGMIHLGQEDFYSELIESLDSSRTLILAEGVSDNDGRLKEHFSYGKIADLLGLESQEKISFPGRVIESLDADHSDSDHRDGPDILRADIDLNQFDPRTLEVLNALAKYVLNSDSLTEGYLEFNRWAQDHISDDLEEVIMNDLINKRNRAVISYLPKALKKNDTIVIPRGALHMQGIEAMVKKRGFRLEASHSRLSIDFLLLPYEKIWE